MKIILAQHPECDFGGHGVSVGLYENNHEIYEIPYVKSLHGQPDNEPAQAAGSNVFNHDVSHQHSWTATEFFLNIVGSLVTQVPVEVVEHNMWNNHFSWATCLRKR